MIGKTELAWFKSSYSDNSNGNDCVEVATVPGTVHVRDSKDVERTNLAFGADAWNGFVEYTAGA
ncbi:DUF397 domain-containing protein [Streptomyces sp. NPDC046203]|uniref:DUF397 domain-containing protein n=1 Tax=Streptomyces sp. NPDC046203 TaxID=3154602 RepID=UPI0033C0ED85